MKKTLFVLLIIATLMCNFSTVAFALDSNEIVCSAVDESPMLGLIGENPNARGANIPDNFWNVVVQGDYHFDGSSTKQTLYTSYYFTGARNYYVSANNRQDSDQKVTVVTTDGDELATYTIPKEGSITFNVSTNEPWYLKFPGGMFSDGTNVYGMVRDIVE